METSLERSLTRDRSPTALDLLHQIQERLAMLEYKLGDRDYQVIMAQLQATRNALR